MRVLHVIPGLAASTGGPPVAVVESSLALKRIGVETAIFTTDVGESAAARHHRRADASDLPEGAATLLVHRDDLVILP